MKLSKNREKYLLEKYFQTKNTKNIPSHITQFGCRDCDTTDEDLFFITQYVTEIDRLSLGGSLVTKDGLEYLKKLTKVNYLDLAEVPLSDENLDCILHLQEVDYLYIKHTKVTSKGISQILQSFPKLETLLADIENDEESLIEFWKNKYPKCELIISFNL
ncbi:hypothetical protein TRIP_D300026 [uncultured Paludibacter sp.]|uniref:Uncharacterized protein n=1 Tax=uncultured Paludibacter sp. TaxID=497635 RepID=A0A653AAQ6_9BACT|nr:hypothetical protein TRIP_D300026 [uncultured Paludibacter sp.]